MLCVVVWVLLVSSVWVRACGVGAACVFYVRVRARLSVQAVQSTSSTGDMTCIGEKSLQFGVHISKVRVDHALAGGADAWVGVWTGSSHGDMIACA